MVEEGIGKERVSFDQLKKIINVLESKENYCDKIPFLKIDKIIPKNVMWEGRDITKFDVKIKVAHSEKEKILQLRELLKKIIDLFYQ